MLIGRYSVLDKHPGRDIGGGAIGLGVSRFGFNKSAMNRGAFSSEAWEPKSGVPDGYRPPYAWILPQTDGGLAARNNLVGLGAFVGAISGGKNAEALLAGSGSVTATLQLIISLVAALTGSGTISNAAIIAYLQLAATLAGAGNLAGAINALAFAQAALAGSGTATVAPYATGALAASITVSGDILTSTSVGPAVWQTLIESGYSAQQLLRLLTAVVVNDATDLESDPEFKSIDGSKTRIAGTVAGGDRTITTIDPD